MKTKQELMEVLARQIKEEDNRMYPDREVLADLAVELANLILDVKE